MTTTVRVAELLEVLVSEPAALVMLPAAFDTTTSNVDPLSAAVAAGVVYPVSVAPGMFTEFCLHW